MTIGISAVYYTCTYIKVLKELMQLKCRNVVFYVFYDAAIRKQGRHGQFLAGKSATAGISSAVAFYSAKPRQGLGLEGVASPDSPGMLHKGHGQIWPRYDNCQMSLLIITYLM